MIKNFQGGLMCRVKEGGPNPAANAALAQLLQQAKDTDVPKEIIDRNIKKATDKGQQDFVELTYEVFSLDSLNKEAQICNLFLCGLFAINPKSVVLCTAQFI